MLSKLYMIGWITLTSSAFVSLAVAQSPQIAGTPEQADYPLVAEAVTDDVFVRSGRGPGYYHCGTLDTGDRVTVVEETGGWAKILPRPEHYSWIHKNHVRLNPDDPAVGTVTSDNVRVWAGSDYIEPIRSFSIQARLNAGEVVELFDPAQPETGDYYKIKVPSGGFLWVSSENLRYVGPFEPEPEPEPEPVDVEQPRRTLEERLGVDADTPPTPAARAEQQEEAAEPSPDPEEPDEEPDEPDTEPEPAAPSTETVYLQRCHELIEKINAELQKPMDEQDYSAFKDELAAMLEDPEAGKAKLYAQNLLNRIEGFELALGVTDTLRQQNERLERLRAQIESAHQSRLHQIPDPQQVPLFTGTVRPSFVYSGRAGQQRYLLTDENGRIACYLVPGNMQIENRLKELVNTRIGIRGDIISDPQALVTVVSVTSIVPTD